MVRGSLWLLTIVTLGWQPAMSQELRIQHVVIASPERPQPRRDATVIVKEGRIAAILESDTARRSEPIFCFCARIRPGPSRVTRVSTGSFWVAA